MTKAALALPGDIATVTGGFIYDRRLYEELAAAGRDMRLIRLPDRFPFPSEDEMHSALTQLQDLPASCPVIIDGLAFGALTPSGVAQITAPIVALVHHPLALESGLPEAEQKHLFQTERENLRFAAQVLVPSPHIKTVLVAQYDVPEDRIHVARPGIVQPVHAEKKDDAHVLPPLILSVGILHPRKGHDVLIKALQMTADLEWRATIVGTPWEDGYDAVLQEQITQSGLATRVDLAGRVTDSELARLYGQAHLFALATRYEGYGIVFNEALVHGLPIISCQTGAVPDTVPSGAGLLVARDDPSAFAEALRRVLTDPQRHSTMANAAASSGKKLSGWADTARIAGHALDLAAGHVR